MNGDGAGALASVAVVFFAIILAFTAALAMTTHGYRSCRERGGGHVRCIVAPGEGRPR